MVTLSTLAGRMPACHRRQDAEKAVAERALQVPERLGFLYGMTFSVRPAERHLRPSGWRECRGAMDGKERHDPELRRYRLFQPVWRPQLKSLGIHASLAWVRLFSKACSVSIIGGRFEGLIYACN
jgi:hypothetical protein